MLHVSNNATKSGFGRAPRSVEVGYYVLPDIPRAAARYFRDGTGAFEELAVGNLFLWNGR